MKIQHKVNPGYWHSKPAEVDADYQEEIDRTLEKARVAYERAERRLVAAEARLAKAERRAAPSRRQIEELELLVMLRRDELDRYRRMMVSVPQAAVNRGTKSFRPLGFGGA